MLLFAISGKELAKQLERRMGQCVLTSPTSAVFAGRGATGSRSPLGKNLRYFGDGFQTSKLIGGHRYWRMPVMDGDFLIEDTTDVVSGVGGGNFLVLAESLEQTLTACEAAIGIDAPGAERDHALPRRGGTVRLQGGLQVSRRSGPRPTTRSAPRSAGITTTQLSPEIGAVLEIVIDGLTPAAVISRACGRASMPWLRWARRTA